MTAKASCTLGVMVIAKDCRCPRHSICDREMGIAKFLISMLSKKIPEWKEGRKALF